MNPSGVCSLALEFHKKKIVLVRFLVPPKKEAQNEHRHLKDQLAIPELKQKNGRGRREKREEKERKRQAKERKKERKKEGKGKKEK